jgi:hypothetical protein
MQLRRVFRYCARVLVIAGAAAVMMGGCSRQGEGERCDYRWGGDSDCDDGLVCTACVAIRDSTVDRCCPPTGSAYEDARCTPGANTSGLCDANMNTSGGTGGTAGTAGTGGTAGTDATSGGTGGTDVSPGGADNAGGTDAGAGG